MIGLGRDVDIGGTIHEFVEDWFMDSWDDLSFYLDIR